MRSSISGTHTGRWFTVAHTTELDVHSHAGRCQHPDQRIDAEELDLPSNEIADPRLRNSEERRGIALPESLPLNRVAHSIHQFGAESQMRGANFELAGAMLGGSMRSGASRPISIALIARLRHESRRKRPP